MLKYKIPQIVTLTLTKPLLVKVGALCIKKEGAHFDTPSFVIATGFKPVTG